MTSLPPQSERQSDVLVIRLRSDDGMNALNDDTVDALIALVAETAAMPQLHGVVLTGDGVNFSAGGDFAQLARFAARIRENATGRAEVAARIRTNSRLIEAIRDLNIVTVAAVDGACVGAALGISAACDVRIATPRALFTTGFVKLGLSPDFGTAYLLSELLGRSTANRWLLGSERINADTALAAGFVDQIVEKTALIDSAIAVATLWNTFPVATAGIKAGVREAFPSRLRPHLDAEPERFVQSLEQPRALEAISAANRHRAKVSREDA